MWTKTDVRKHRSKLTERLVDSSVRVPVDILATRSGVQVDDGVDAVLGTEVDHAVQVLQALALENTGVYVILKVTVVDLSSARTAAKLTGRRIQFKPREAKNLASSSVKKYSRNWS